MMTAENNLTRFLEAQLHDYEHALTEVRLGRKTGHWMWYIFPQIIGLGSSENARFFGIRNKLEAMEYLNHPVLGPRLIEISTALLSLKGKEATSIFGGIDSLKLQSSMTLFSLIDKTSPVFEQVLDKFFGGVKDRNTIQIING